MHQSSRLLTNHRLRLPALSNKAYLNFGAQGTAPQDVFNAIAESNQVIQSTGPLSDKLFAWLESEVRQTREALSQELGGEPLSFALTQNTTEGCNIVMWGLNWREGDRLLLTDCEHPGVVAAAEQISRRLNLRLDYCHVSELTRDLDIVACVKGSLTDRTRLFVFSHVLWNTGQVLPVEAISELCRERSVLTLVDGAQSAGVLPLDLFACKCDFYAFTGHKWFCGPEGVGALYIRPESLDLVQPTFVGWRGITMDARGRPTGWRQGAARFEVATAPFPLLAGLRAALAFHRQWGSATDRFNQITASANYLRQRLAGIPGVECLAGNSSLVSFRMRKGGHRELVAWLETRGIVVRTIPDPPCIRASLHYFTDVGEINDLIDGIVKFVP